MGGGRWGVEVGGEQKLLLCNGLKKKREKKGELPEV